MAKKSMIARETKRRYFVRYYQPKREEIKKKIKQTRSLEERLFLSMELQALPRNSSPTRLTNRCFITGRPKGYYRDFGLSRHVFREMAHKCLLPGVRKSSW
jgi:small subunit ribosomal protein S14